MMIPMFQCPPVLVSIVARFTSGSPGSSKVQRVFLRSYSSSRAACSSRRRVRLRRWLFVRLGPMYHGWFVVRLDEGYVSLCYRARLCGALVIVEVVGK